MSATNMLLVSSGGSFTTSKSTGCSAPSLPMASAHKFPSSIVCWTVHSHPLSVNVESSINPLKGKFTPGPSSSRLTTCSAPVSMITLFSSFWSRMIIRSPGLSGQKSLPYVKAVPLSFRKPRSAIRPSEFHNGKENSAPKNGFDVTPIGPTGQRNIQVIPKVEAVCKVCFKGLEVGRAIKSECTCTKNAFTHEKCAPTWSSRQQGHICGNCKGKIQNIHVDLTPVK